MWLLALAPPAYALVLGYADAVLLPCAVGVFLGIRTDRWWWAAAAGLAAGAVRPVGVLLLVPVAVELWSRRHGSPPHGRGSAAVAALVAPLVGAGAYLVWVGHRFADAWLPFTVQQQGGHRGRLAAPFDAMWHDLRRRRAWATTWAAPSTSPGWWCAWPWPWWPGDGCRTSYALFATAVLVVSLSSTNLDSFERYALGAFPLVVAASTGTSRRSVEVVVLVASAAAMTGYATLSFLGIVVP